MTNADRTEPRPTSLGSIFERRTYRNASYPVIGYLTALISFSVVLGVAIGDHHAEVWEVALLAVCLAAVTLIAIQIYVHPRVISDSSGITVINPMHSVFVPWSEVEKVSAGMRLLVRRTDGTAVVAWAVQAVNAARMTGRRSFADDVAEDLNRLLVESRGGDWTAEAPTYAVSPIKIKALQRQALMAAGIVLVIILIRALT